MSNTIAPNPAGTGATVVIHHRVKPGLQGDYESWLSEIGPQCQRAAGHLDSQVVRPLAGLSDAYAFIIRFDTEAHLRAWMSSPVRQRLIEKAQSLLVDGDQFRVHGGLEWWSSNDGPPSRMPRRWKQYLVTWSAIYPLILGVPPLIVPGLHRLDITSNYLEKLFVSGIVVGLMVYVVMPRYTKLVHDWLSS